MADKEVKSFLTPEFRVSYPNVFKATTYEEGGELKFNLICLWYPELFSDKDKLLWKKINKGLDDALKEKFGASAVIGKKFSGPFWDGNEKTDDDGNIKIGYEDATWARIQSKNKPTIKNARDVVSVEKDKNGEIIKVVYREITEPSEFYGGCWARATVSIYTYSHAKGKKGVHIGLMNLIKIRDDDPFGGGRSNADEDFAMVEPEVEDIGSEDDDI